MRTFAVRTWMLAGLAAIAIALSFGQLPEELKRKFDEAERRIVRLQPTAFPELPANVVRELQRRGCAVPQEAYTKKPHNVISRTTSSRVSSPNLAKPIGLSCAR